jgi:hypothetical protein
LKVKVLLIFILIYSSSAFSQINFTIGGSLGGGSFSGYSPSISGFTTSAFVETNLALFDEVYPRIGFILTKDFNAILPNDVKQYYPYLIGFTAELVTYQFFENNIFLEENVGLLALSDHTSGGLNTWDYGALFSLTAGYDLRNFNLEGFKVGLGIEYGLTFFNTLPQFSSIHAIVHYTI